MLCMLVLWGLCGDKFSVVLNQGNRLKYFNILMGAFLILSALLILIDFFKLVVLHCEDITTRQQLCLSHLKRVLSLLQLKI